MDEFALRARLAKLHADSLVDEALNCARRGDFNRLDEVSVELELVTKGLREIHEEQLIHYLPKPNPTKKRWWRRG